MHAKKEDYKYYLYYAHNIKFMTFGSNIFNI